LTWENITGGEAGDSGIINMEDEDDELSDQVGGRSYEHPSNSVLILGSMMLWFIDFWGIESMCTNEH